MCVCASQAKTRREPSQVKQREAADTCETRSTQSSSSLLTIRWLNNSQPPQQQHRESSHRETTARVDTYIRYAHRHKCPPPHDNIKSKCERTHIRSREYICVYGSRATNRVYNNNTRRVRDVCQSAPQTTNTHKHMYIVCFHPHIRISYSCAYYAACASVFMLLYRLC